MYEINQEKLLILAPTTKVCNHYIYIHFCAPAAGKEVYIKEAKKSKNKGICGLSK